MYIYIYIKQRSHAGENEVLPCGAFYEEICVEGHLWKAQWKEKPNDEGPQEIDYE